MSISAETFETPSTAKAAAGTRYQHPLSDRLAGVHIGALDGIRGLAIILVLIFHYGRSASTFELNTPLLKLTGIGWCGVDLFFVLSGFLITGILYDSRGSQHFFRNFYARRALRIFPLYYAAFFLVIILSLVWPEAGVWPTTSLWWIAFYMTNGVMAFQDPNAPGILSHYWSLAIEEHFYLVWPFVVAWLPRRTLMIIACGMIVFALGLRIFALHQGLGSDAVYVLTPMRLDALAAGAFCALAVRGPDGVAALIRPAWIAAISCGTVFALIVLLRRSTDSGDTVIMTVGYTLLAITFAGGLIVGITWRHLNSILNTSVLRWFGRYSYGLYIWHVIINMLLFYTPLKAALGIDGPFQHFLYLVAAFCLVLTVAFASYQLFEKPLLNLKKYFH